MKRATVLHAVMAAALLTSPLMAQGPAQGGQGGRGQGGRGGGRGQGPARTATPIRRMPDGKPDLSGYYSANSGGANYGLERHERDFLTPGTQGVIVDPADGKLPYQD